MERDQDADRKLAERRPCEPSLRCYLTLQPHFAAKGAAIASDFLLALV
jgi:hypothetical protein